MDDVARGHGGGGVSQATFVRAGSSGADGDDDRGRVSGPRCRRSCWSTAWRASPAPTTTRSDCRRRPRSDPRRARERWGTGADPTSSHRRSSTGRGPRVVGARRALLRASSVARARMQATLELDVRGLLPLIQVPTLVVHSRDNALVRIGHGRYLAEHIAGARLVELDGADHTLSFRPRHGRTDRGAGHGCSECGTGAERVLATVLFVDIVGSTQYASELGDERWRAALGHVERVSERRDSAPRGHARATHGRRCVGDVRWPGAGDPLRPAYL